MRLPRIVETEDGSFTYFNEEFDQIYHSKSGAIEESFKKYVEPAKIKDSMTIVDYCFGLGYNTLAAIAKFDNLVIYALEIDALLMGNLTELTFAELKGYDEDFKNTIDETFLEMATKLKEHIANEETDFVIEVRTSKIHVLVGDATQTISQVPLNSTDAIFWDPFSPKQHPQLWEQSEFAKGYAVLKKGGILATYSYARVVRDGLNAVGFDVRDGPVIGRRCPSTLAFK